MKNKQQAITKKSELLKHLSKLLLCIPLLIAVLQSSCRKEFGNTQIISIEGVIKDDASKQVLNGIFITIDAIKSPSSWEGWDGYRKTVGSVTTDANGHYKVKLKVYNDAERLEFYLNPGKLNSGYVDSQPNIQLSSLNLNGNNKFDFTLSPIGILKIHFRNAIPIANTDFFYFGWSANGNGWPAGLLQKENCGTVSVSQALTWTGKDVCGIFTIGTIAEQFTHIWWHVEKGGVINLYRDSVYVKRGVVTDFNLNY